MAFPVALFFDLDGTLVDSEPIHWRAWQQTLSRYDVMVSWDLYHEVAVGTPDYELARLFRERFPRPLGDVDESVLLQGKTSEYRLVAEREPLIERQMVEALRSISGVPTALVTMSTRADAELLLSSVGILDVFHTRVFVEDVSAPKPAPDAYLLAQQRLGVSGGVAFEDSARGVASARAANLEVIQVSGPSEVVRVLRERWG